jgi:flavin reductase (DIM6/NTAB) family NADH-FMN oxidoreductase RutF
MSLFSFYKFMNLLSFTYLKETEDFVVNIVSDWMVEAASHTCGAWPPDVDEFQKSGLTPMSSEIVGPPRVEESAFHMECKLFSKTEIFNDKGARTSTIVLGRVVRFHVKEKLLEQNAAGMPVMNTLGLQPCGRLGGDTWALLGKTFDIKRPVV